MGDQRLLKRDIADIVLGNAVELATEIIHGLLKGSRNSTNPETEGYSPQQRMNFVPELIMGILDTLKQQHGIPVGSLAG
ncbi:hypothetical protein SPFM7_00027 [Salmonella phage SPFM7]|nr:hypothetical protein SPFM7_00027 [Salmonella phage SPFM7]